MHRAVFLAVPSKAARVAAKQLSELIGQLLGEQPPLAYSPEEFSTRIQALLQRFQSRDRLQTFFMRYSLCMTEVTYQRLHQPAPPPDQRALGEFLDRLLPYPEASQEFSQCSVDPASSLRRAESVHRHLRGGGRVLALGDDDATGLALSLLGDYQIKVVDIDERVIAWLGAMGVSGEVHDLRQLPDSYAGAFDGVITDPPRDLDLAGEFLKAAARCLAPGGLLFWCDHPDWNQAALALLEQARRYGLELLEEHPNWHCYVPHVVSDDTAHHFGIPARWFHDLVQYARVWSHLYVLRKRS